MSSRRGNHKTNPLGRAPVLGVIVLLVLSCVSHQQYEQVKRSVEAVQAACVEAGPLGGTDGWGHKLYVVEISHATRMAISPGRDGKMDRDAEQYLDETAICGVTSSLDDDIVCISGRFRRWPELTSTDRERVLKLPLDCEQQQMK